MPMIASRLEARKSRKSRRLAFDRLEDRTVPVTGLVVSVTPDVVSESVGSVTGRVTRVDTSLALPLTVRLTSADPARVTVPDTVVIPAGESMATFPVGVIDDTIPGNSASIIVSAAGAVTTTLAVDGSFGYPPGSGRMIFSTVGGQTRSITQAPDGKIVVVGSSNNSSSPPTIRVARYLANGLLDTTGFRRTGSGGILTGVFDIELTPFSDQAQAVAVQPDRKILIAGNVVGLSAPAPYNLFITRLNEDGSSDTSFGTGGLVTLNTTPGFTSVWDMALLADGKFLVTGSGGTSLKLARFNADGSLDTTYGVGGFASAPMSDNGSAYTVAMQADGKAVVAGQTNGGDPKPGLARFNTDGTLDTSFGSGGVVIDDIPGGREGIYDLTIQPDGKLLAAGWFGPYVPPAGDNYNSFILRYNPDGTRDTSFDDDGLVLEDLGDPDYFSGVGVLPDGRIIASGSAFTVTPAASIRTNVVRYLPNGQRDDRATTTLFDFNEGLTVMPDGRVVSAGNNANGGGVEGFRTFVNASASAFLHVIDNDNQPPAANPDAYDVDEDQILSVAAPGVLGNDTDPNGDPLTALLSASPGHGALTLNANGSFTYTPAANFNGTDSFTYRARDPFGAVSAATTVTITVRPVNDAPTAAADNYATDEDVGITVPAPGVLSNDSDVDGDPLTAALISGPAHGTLTLNSDGSFTYTPAANFNGTDSFTYKASDGTLDSGVTTVTLTVRPVNDPPSAFGQDVTTSEDTPVTGTLTATDPDGDPLIFALVTGPAHGTVTINPTTGAFNYTPAANFNGPDAFEFKANDGLVDSPVATVRLTITPVNDAPIAAGDTYSTNEDATLTVTSPGVLGNDLDVDGDPLTAVLVSGPAHGALTLNSNGSFTYVPAANFNGTDSFTYKPNDGQVDGNTATVTISVSPVNDAPVAAPESYRTAEDTPLTVPAPGVLANDTDVDGDPLTAVLAADALHGHVALSADGSFTYTPNADYNGPDFFLYKASDGQLDSLVVKVDLTVDAVNDAPVATGDTYAVDEDGSLDVARPGVLANDTDVDGDPLTAALVTGPAHGALTFNSDGSFRYVPAANFNGTDLFTYKANDGALDSSEATVRITVNAVNDPPVAGPDSFTVSEDQILAVAAPGVLSNDSDIDGDPLTAVLVSGPSHGTLTLAANGSFTYVPGANYFGRDSFVYKPNDGTADGLPATVSLTVNSVNDAPSFTTGADQTVLEDAGPQTVTAWATAISPGPTNESGQAVTFEVVGNTNPALFAAGPAISPTGTLTYTAAADANGTATITLRARDDGGTANGGVDVSAIQSFTITVTALPDVASVVVNRGDVQRSRVTEIAVSFDMVVDATLLATAFTLTRTSDGATVGAIGVATALQNGRTVATLTFAGANTEFGSLADGLWTLRVNAARVRGSNGVLMAADYTAGLHRLFGDSDGDRDVDAADEQRFNAAYGSKIGQAAYVAYFDYDHDGRIGTKDRTQLRQRLGRRI